MITTVADPRHFDLARRLVAILSAISRETAQAHVVDLDPSAVSEISGLSYDALVACQRLQLLTGLPTPFPQEPEFSRMTELEPSALELFDLMSAELDPDVQILLASIARVLAGTRRYVQLA
ncbi:hypothetical protein [Aeromicrobium sp. Sec7.5]|uniref:hypothetical protein n=1 Tax=Aeromicrobium sp. Sec7.5 TaxID=3121276 RepID=UPI002FE4AD40